MRVGVAIGQVLLGDGATVPVRELADQAAEAERLGFDSIWLMDHFWVDRDGRRRGGHEPLTSLGYLAARTERVRLGILVLCQAFRHVGQLAREAAALADASGGRLILGLGAGWYDPEFEAFGLPPGHKVSRLAELLPPLRALLQGERVSVGGRWTTLRDASVVTTAPPPPILVAAGGDRMLELTALHADAWNLAWGRSPDAGWIAEPLARLRDACARVGRDPAELEVTAGAFWTPESSLGLAALCREYEAAGVDHLIVNLSESPFALRDRAYLAVAGEELAAFRG